MSLDKALDRLIDELKDGNHLHFLYETRYLETGQSAAVVVLAGPAREVHPAIADVMAALAEHGCVPVAEELITVALMQAHRCLESDPEQEDCDDEVDDEASAEA